MLFFELFPAFLAIVSVIIGVMLYGRNLRARHEPDPVRPAVRPSTDATDSSEREARPRRPSMER